MTRQAAPPAMERSAPVTHLAPEDDAVVRMKLHEYRTLAAAEIDRRLPDAEPRRYLYDLLADYPRRGGKGMRAALCIAACRAFGGAARDALPAAAGIELLHNAFLVHDDIEDGSRLRRARLTLHEEHGIPLALNAGDGLLHLAYATLVGAAPPGRRGRDMLAALDATISHSVEGQALDLGWQRDPDAAVGVADYLEMVAKKTACYSVVAPLLVGSSLGLRPPADPARLAEFGGLLGVAFQIRDDVLDVTRSASGGKDFAEDVRTRKRTLPLLMLMDTVDGPDRAWVMDTLLSRDGQPDDAGVARLVALLHDRGCVRFAAECAARFVGAARDVFPAAFAGAVPGDDLVFLRSLGPHLLRAVQA